MTDAERRELTALYDRLTARVRDHDALAIPIPPELASAVERARRRLDGPSED